MARRLGLKELLLRLRWRLLEILLRLELSLLRLKSLLRLLLKLLRLRSELRLLRLLGRLGELLLADGSLLRPLLSLAPPKETVEGGADVGEEAAALLSGS